MLDMGMSQAELASLVGVRRESVNRLEQIAAELGYVDKEPSC